MASKQKPLVVTTQKGVFFGYGTPDLDAQHVRIDKCRMVVYWSADVRSVVGLASTGPSKGCRIGPAAPSMIVRDCTAVIECTPEAAEKFEAAPWSN